MAYNPYDAVNAIYKLKGQWSAANAAGDDAKKNAAAKAAQEYYSKLRNSNYGALADELAASSYEQAKSINDKWAKMGKTSTRDYLYSLGQSYGLSSGDVDKLISWDNQTGEVSFGGKKIGTPDSVVDGVSYWGDTSVLDGAFDDYVARSGVTRSKDSAVNQENESLFKKYNQEYEDLKNTNPFTTDEAKAILAKYDLAGLQGRDNAVAAGAGSNGGNIDSYAAANAMRQQSALVNQGQLTVLQAHQQKLDHARALLSDMGVNIDRVFNQSETEKNNAVSRDVAINEATGFNTDSQLKASSALWNSDGSLADTNTDYQAEINRVEGLLNSTQSDEEKQTYALTLKLLEMARNDKIAQTGSSESKTYKYQKLFDNATMKIDKEKIAQADRTLLAGQADNAAERDHEINKIKTSAALGVSTSGSGTSGSGGTTQKAMTGSQAATALKNGEINDTILNAYNTHNGTSYTVDNPPPVYKPAGLLTDKEVESWVNSLNTAISSDYPGKTALVPDTSNPGNYKPAEGVGSEYIILRVLKSDKLTDEQKKHLLADRFGIGEDRLQDVVADMLKDPHYK